MIKEKSQSNTLYLPKKTCLKEYCDLRFVQCGIVSLLLNYITFVTRDDPSVGKYLDIGFQKVSINFRKGSSSNLDKLKISVQDKSFIVQRSELASADDVFSLPNSEQAYSEFI